MEIQFNEDKSPFVMWGHNKITLEPGPFEEKYYKEKAEVELRETPENIEKGLRELRELLKGELFIFYFDCIKYLLMSLRGV